MMNRRIALAVNHELLVTALDFAGSVLVVDIEDGVVSGKKVEGITAAVPALRAGMLREFHISAVLCGAVSNPLSMMVWYSGIEVIAGLSGHADRIVEAYLQDTLPRFTVPDFHPGYGQCRGMGRKRRFRGGRGRLRC